jgi:HPt (histidine-containing phosphotransfer) domain-containing protein
METNGTQDSYLEMIEAFYDIADEKGSELGSLYDEKDFDNYLFKIDEIKSSVRIIGATKLGEEARLLENAAKKKDFDYICNKHEEFMRKYDELKEMLGVIL